MVERSKMFPERKKSCLNICRDQRRDEECGQFGLRGRRGMRGKCGKRGMSAGNNCKRGLSGERGMSGMSGVSAGSKNDTMALPLSS